MEILLILIALAFGTVRFLQLKDDDLPSIDGEEKLDADPVGHGPGADYSYNPATGLPMLHGGPDGLDIEGNMWGFDDEMLSMHRHPADQSLLHDFDELFSHEAVGSAANPATGLPMISGDES